MFANFAMSMCNIAHDLEEVEVSLLVPVDARPFRLVVGNHSSCA